MPCNCGSAAQGDLRVRDCVQPAWLHSAIELDVANESRWALSSASTDAATAWSDTGRETGHRTSAARRAVHFRVRCRAAGRNDRSQRSTAMSFCS